MQQSYIWDSCVQLYSPPHNCFISHRKIQGRLLSSVRTVSLGGSLCNPGGRPPNDATSQYLDRISVRVEGADQKQRVLEGVRPDLKATAKKVSCCRWAHLLSLKTLFWVCPAIGTAEPSVVAIAWTAFFFPFCCHKTRGAPYKMRVHISNHSWPRIKYYLMPVVKRIWTPSRLLKLNPQ